MDTIDNVDKIVDDTNRQICDELNKYGVYSVELAEAMAFLLDEAIDRVSESIRNEI